MTLDELVKEEDLLQEQGFAFCRGGALMGMNSDAQLLREGLNMLTVNNYC